MDLRRLRYFLVLSEELHFGRASARLHIAQPALSQQIRRLEDDLGVRLFERTHHKVTLTQVGSLMLAEVRALLAQSDRVHSTAARGSRGELGRVSVGFVGSALYGVLPALLRAVRTGAPELQLDTRELETGEQVEALHEGTLDVGFLRPPVEPMQAATQLATRLVDVELLVAALPAGDPRTVDPRTVDPQTTPPRIRAVDLADLAGEVFVAFPRELGPGYYDLIVSGCRAAGFSPRIQYEAQHIHTMVGLVASGLGVALVPANVTRLQLPGVRYLPMKGQPLELGLAVAWRPDRVTPALSRFVALATPAESATRPPARSGRRG